MAEAESSTSPCVQPTHRKAAERRKLFESSPKNKTALPVQKTPMIQLVIKAIKAVANSDFTTSSQTLVLKKAILKGIESGTIIRPPHSKDATGITGSFALPLVAKKKSPGNVTAKSILNEKPSKAAKKLKEKNTAEDMTALKESERKTKPRQLLLEETSNAKKDTKNPSSSKVSKRAVKKVTPTKQAVKKVVKNKAQSSPEAQGNGIADVGSDSDKENVDYPEKQTKQENTNTAKAKQGKVTVTKEPKEDVLKNAVQKGEVKPKKVKGDKTNIKAITKQLKTNREALKQLDIQAFSVNTEVTEIRKDASDTELDTKHDNAKYRKSYASDTELEVSRRMIHKNKKLKTEKKPLVKKLGKKADETVSTNVGNDSDNTETLNSQNQPKMRKAKKRVM